MAQCRCRNETRYYLAHCPDAVNHIVWADLPPFEDFITRGAERYHEDCMRDGTVKRVSWIGDGRCR